MGRVLTNAEQLNYAVEASLGTQPSTGWKRLLPTGVNEWGAKFKKVASNPISKERQRRKGSIVDLDSTVKFTSDFYLENMIDFIQGFVLAHFRGGSTSTPHFVVTGVTATGYTVAANGNLAQNQLIYGSGFATAANNGLKKVGAASIATEIKTAGLAVEAPAANANPVVMWAGVEAAANILSVTVAGSVVTILSAGAVDWTTLGLKLGMEGFLGDNDSGAIYSPANAATYGLFRVKSFTATNLVVERTTQAWVADPCTDKTIRVLFGAFARNVAVDDPDYNEPSFHFEFAHENLADPGPGDEYEYAKGNYCNALVTNIPLGDKATVEYGFVGQDTPAPVTVRATGANNAKTSTRVVMMNTSADVARLIVMKVDETGLTTDFKNLKITINNNVTGEKVIGRLGPRYINVGNLHVDIEADVLFTSSGVLTAIRQNLTVGFTFTLRNTDGGITYDIPSMTLDGGDRELPENETVRLKLTGMAHIDPILNTSIGITIFPYLPLT